MTFPSSAISNLEGDAASDPQANAAADRQTDDDRDSGGHGDVSSDPSGLNYSPTDTNSDAVAALRAHFGR